MTTQEIEQILIEVLVEIQTASGQASVSLDRHTQPLGGIPGFDSILAVEAAVALEHRLGREIPDINVFVDEEQKKILSIAEVAERLCRLFSRHEEAHD